jgi:hypothetical protein
VDFGALAINYFDDFSRRFNRHCKTPPAPAGVMAPAGEGARFTAGLSTGRAAGALPLFWEVFPVN